jgi:hypothetical protein
MSTIHERGHRHRVLTPGRHTMANAEITSGLVRTSAEPKFLTKLDDTCVFVTCLVCASMHTLFMIQKQDLGSKIPARNSPYMAYGVIEFGFHQFQP